MTQSPTSKPSLSTLDPSALRVMSRIAEMFWSKVMVVHRSRCWNWTAGMDKHGYGMVRTLGKTIRAHRVAFFLRNGFWPNQALHKCDNPTCCNPDHLYNGDHAQNMADHAQRGKGQSERSATELTESIVLHMRERYATGEVSIPALAKEFGASPSATQRAVAGNSFRHLKPYCLAKNLVTK